MFVGHYAVSLALKRVEGRASLGVLFLGVQFLDILFFPFALAGIERFNIVPNYTASTHFELVYMPYSHSLVAAFVWSAFAYAVLRWIVVKSNAVAILVAVAVFSHWILDLIVHTPDLPLWSDASTKLGFGLWNHALATFLLEAMLLLAGLWLYLRASRAETKLGRYGMAVFVAALIAVNVPNIFGAAPSDGQVALPIVALAAYFAFAGIAFWLDRKRLGRSKTP